MSPTEGCLIGCFMRKYNKTGQGVKSSCPEFVLDGFGGYILTRSFAEPPDWSMTLLMRRV